MSVRPLPQGWNEIGALISTLNALAVTDHDSFTTWLRGLRSAQGGRATEAQLLDNVRTSRVALEKGHTFMVAAERLLETVGRVLDAEESKPNAVAKPTLTMVHPAK